MVYPIIDNKQDSNEQSDDGEDENRKLITFDAWEYDLILELVQNNLDRRMGHDTVAFRQIKRKLLYNANKNYI